MNRRPRKKRSNIKSIVIPIFALIILLGIGSYALLGPTGILAWTDYKSAITLREQELISLEQERDALKNRVKLLEKDNVDPDLAGELMRRDLNVVAPDEVIIPLE